jgi:tRNA(Leu) C34 or U34 (ribose-2'-O)-methylase TrmL
MSLKGNAEGSFKVRGKLTTLDYLMITAYGVAVKNGFEGTEEEWLEYLRGNAIAAEQAAEEAKAYSESAKSSATTATEQAGIAESQANTAKTMAGNAEIFANAAAMVAAGLTPRVETLESQMADLLYEPIAVTNFGAIIRTGTAELGDTITAVTLSWARNKEAIAQTLDGESIDPASTTKNLTGLNISSDKSWTLIATDERGATATKTASVTFRNGVYYGAGAEPEGVDTSFLTKTLSDTRKRTFIADAGDGEYIWYALPVRLGECTFKVGGFEGGFDLYATVPFTNAYGYTEDYRIYRSARAGLGATTVEVS